MNYGQRWVGMPCTPRQFPGQKAFEDSLIFFLIDTMQFSQLNISDFFFLFRAMIVDRKGEQCISESWIDGDQGI
jgi:hypothetical protein